MRLLTSLALYRSLRGLALLASKNQPADASAGRWRVVVSVCLERFPIICPELDAIQKRYKKLVSAVEFENSLLSEHEVRLIEDQKRLEQRRASRNDESTDPEDRVVTALDFEDACIQEFEAFRKRYLQRIENVTDDKSLKRCLSRKLVLVVHNPIKKRWLFPEAYLNDGETLYDASRRALSTLLDIDQCLLPYGFAPTGFHKFKYPKPLVKQNNAAGEKIFFYKCQLQQKSFPNCVNVGTPDHKWLTHGELVQYVPSSYYKSVRKCLIE
uniref:39S ribosomal protein L46, mitochondrial n=1 Tax=Trichuris muris TaxID=70415 RepID=A0A5S6QW53_TRIMR